MGDGVKSPGRWLTLILALSALLYLRGLAGGFVWDDRLFFVDNDILPSWKFWQLHRILLEPSTYWDDYIPATNFLFVLQYGLFGKNPFGYHVVSLLLYLSTGMLVYRLTGLLYGNAMEGNRFVRLGKIPLGPQAGALLVTAFFMLHPAHVEVVAYITGQKDLLYGLFSLLALYFLANAQKGAQGAQGGRGVGRLALATVFYYLAFLSKGMAVATAMFIPIFWVMVIRRRGTGFMRPLGVWALLNLPVIAWVLFGVLGSVNLLGVLGGMAGRLLLGLRVFGAHSMIFLLPWPLNFGYPFDAAGGWDINMLAGIVALAVLCAVFLVRPRSLAAFGAAWFFVYIIPALQVLVRMDNAVVFDRYLYISVLGGGILFERLLSVALSSYGRWLDYGRRAGMAAALCVLAMYCLITFNYVPVFKSDVASLGHAYRHFPGWSRAAFDYVYALIEAGELRKAARLTATEDTFASPPWVRPYFTGWIMLRQGRLDEAIVYLEAASYETSARGYFPFPDVPLGRAYMQKGQYEKARGALGRVLAQRLRNPLDYYKAKILIREIDRRAGGPAG